MKRAAVGLSAVCALLTAAGVRGQECLEILHEETFDGFEAGLPLIPQQPCFPACPPDHSWQAWDNNPGAGLSIVTANNTSLFRGIGSLLIM